MIAKRILHILNRSTKMMKSRFFFTEIVKEKRFTVISKTILEKRSTLRTNLSDTICQQEDKKPNEAAILVRSFVYCYFVLSELVFVSVMLLTLKSVWHSGARDVILAIVICINIYCQCYYTIYTYNQMSKSSTVDAIYSKLLRTMKAHPIRLWCV